MPIVVVAVVAAATGAFFFFKKKHKTPPPPPPRPQARPGFRIAAAPSVTAASPPDPRIKRRNDMVKMWADIKSGKLANLYGSVPWLTKWAATLSETYVQDIKQEVQARIAVLNKPAAAPPPPAPPSLPEQAASTVITAATGAAIDLAGSASAGFKFP